MRRARLQWLAAALALFASSLPAPLVAAQRSEQSAVQAKYRELIRKALTEYSQGHWTEAHVFFEDAHAIFPNARTLRGLGATSYEARHYVETISYLEQALSCQVRPLTPRMAQDAGRILEQARRFVSPVELVVEPASAEVYVDGELLTDDKREHLIVDPGEHEFVASAPGYSSDRRVLVAEGGQRLNVHLVLESDVEQAHAEAPPPPPQASASNAPQAHAPRALHSEQSVVAGSVLAVLGVGGIATGWVFYALRQQSRMLVGDVPIQQVELYQNRGYVSFAALGAGVTMLSLSDYFWLPDDAGVPTAAWVVGGLGVAVAATGIALGALGPRCGIGDVRDSCQSPAADAALGPLIALHALPLLSVPLAYAVRGWTRPSGVDVGMNVGATSAGASVTLRARF